MKLIKNNEYRRNIDPVPSNPGYYFDINYPLPLIGGIDMYALICATTRVIV